MSTLRPLALAGAFALAAPLAAQTYAQTGHATAPVIVEALIADIEQVEQKMIALAEAMPASTYDWRPGEGVRSVGEVVMHVAADNYFIPTFAGAAAPASTGIQAGDYPSVQAYESREATKEEAIAALRASFVHLKEIMRGIDEADLAAPLDVFGREMSGLRLWILTATHLHEHLGQSIAYARSNGVVPPWSN